VQAGVLAGAGVSAAYALPTKPMAASETPAKRKLFIVLPPSCCYRRVRALLQYPFHLGPMFIWGTKEIDTVCCAVSLKKNSVNEPFEAERLRLHQLTTALL